MTVASLQEPAAAATTPVVRRGLWSRMSRAAGSALFLCSILSMMGVGIGAVLGYRLSPVLSGSMRPTFAPGAAVLLRPVPVTSVHPGMVVEFVPPGQTAPYAHRVTSVSGDAGHPLISTKGDANPAPDAWRVQLNGPDVNEVVGSVPFLGRVMVFAHRPGALLALLGLVLTGGGLMTTISLYRREFCALAPNTAA